MLIRRTFKKNANEKSIFTTISTSKFSIFKPPVSNKTKLRHLKKSASCFHNCIVFTNIACQVRDRDLDEFFRHENSSFPPAPKKIASYDLE